MSGKSKKYPWKRELLGFQKDAVLESLAALLEEKEQQNTQVSLLKQKAEKCQRQVQAANEARDRAARDQVEAERSCAQAKAEHAQLVRAMVTLERDKQAEYRKLAKEREDLRQARVAIQQQAKAETDAALAAMQQERKDLEACRQDTLRRMRELADALQTLIDQQGPDTRADGAVQPEEVAPVVQRSW